MKTAKQVEVVHRFGTVAIFATLFAAIHVNADKGCIFNFNRASEFDLECNNARNVWGVNEPVKESPNKKILILQPGKEGCLKIKRPVSLNSSYPITLKFYQDEEKEEGGKILVRLIPKEGNCSDEECLWDVLNDVQFKPKEWITAEHTFPLKSSKEYYVQLQANGGKGKFLLDSFILPSDNSSRCQEVSEEAADEGTRLIPDPLVGVAGNDTNDCNFVELSKNLMLTSASVLTLNNLFN